MIFLFVCTAFADETQSPKVLFDTSHDCFWTDAEVAEKFTLLTTIFTAGGFEVVVGDQFAALDDYAVAIFALPQSEFTVDDVAKVRNYLDAGGTVLVMGEWGGWFSGNSNINNLLADLETGVQIIDDSVEDPVNNFEDQSFQILVTDFADNCLNAGLGEILMTGAAPLVLLNPDSALYYSSADSYCLDSPDTLGPFPMAAIADPETHPNWNLIVAGDTSHLTDYGLAYFDNAKQSLMCVAETADDDDDDDDDSEEEELRKYDDGDVSGGCGC
jgi:hypothetical protein